MGVDSLKVQDESIALFSLGTGLKLSLLDHLFGEGAIAVGSGASMTSGSYAKINDFTTREGCFGISTNQRSEYVFSLGYRFGMRNGSFTSKEMAYSQGGLRSEAFSQSLNGLSARIASNSSDSNGFLDLWLYSSSVSRAELSGGNGLRVRFGMTIDF